ncbi:MAG: RNA methyltransferase [Clostridia bacterium]|nr:RNA methyltransferase [Clostridia bacterium]
MQDLTYISSRNNPYVQKYAKLSDKKYRESDKLFLIEGAKLFEEAVDAGVAFESVLLLNGKENEIISRTYHKMKEIKEYGGVNFFLLSESAFSKISTEKSPDGVICVAKYLDNLKFYNKIESNDAKKFQGEKIMLLCSLRDSGNVGTIVRSAVAFGFDRIILSSDSADPYNSRSMRAAMGAFFKIKIDFVNDFSSTVAALMDSGRRVFCAEFRDCAKSLDDIAVTKDDCFIIGNEGHGIPAEISKKCTASVYIPMAPNSESLNAAIAASVLLFVQR